MVRIIDICSGKGGVGKTTIASNLAVALSRFCKTAVIDMNLTTAHLGLSFGIESAQITINSVLKNEAKMNDAIYTHKSGLSVIPGSLRLEDIVNIDISGLRESIKEVFSDYEIVLLDSSPGLGREALIPLKMCDEVIFIANPQIPSLIDVAKCSNLSSYLENMPKKLGIILNRVRGKSYEVKPEDVRNFVDMPVIGTVPEDESIMECSNRNSMVIISNKKSPSSRAFFKIAAKLSGAEYHAGFFDKLKGLFGKEAG